MYKSYGGKGVRVDPRWFSFENFLYDIQKLNGWNKTLVEQGKLDLDKDLLIRGNKIYSKHTCCLVSHFENLSYKPSVSKRFIAIDPNGKAYVAENVSKFSRENNLNPKTVLKVLHNKLKHHRGWSFRYDITS